MWLARQMRSAPPTADADMGVTTIAGDRVGVLTRGECQFVFLDTPGLHRARNSLGEYMVRQVGASVSDVDLAVLVTDASEPWEKLTRAEMDLIEQFRKLDLPAVAVLNKIDLLKDKEQLIPMMAVLNEAYPFEQIVPLSAKTGDGEIGRASCRERV